MSALQIFHIGGIDALTVNTPKHQQIETLTHITVSRLDDLFEGDFVQFETLLIADSFQAWVHLLRRRSVA
jgi:hypothetical protein